jgi:hypothetical protein
MLQFIQNLKGFMDYIVGFSSFKAADKTCATVIMFKLG